MSCPSCGPKPIVHHGRIPCAVFGFLLLASCSSPGEDTATPGEGTQPGDCTDRADNGGDGLFDCDDDGYAGSPDCEEADADTDSDTGADTDADTDSDTDTGSADEDGDG
jgi:clumping factor A